METTTSELFWKLVHEKAQITPATEAQTFTRSFTPREAVWERFRTVKGETGTLITDYQVCGEALEEDLEDFENLEIEPRCHPLVLHDPALDLNWSHEAKTLKETIAKGKKPRFAKGGEGKEYGKNYIKNQFKSLDLSMDRLRQVQVRQKLVAIDTDFPKQVPNLEELSVSGHALKTIHNLPPKVICLNARCNQVTSWPSLPNNEIRHLGLSGNCIEALDGLTPEVASQLVRLASLDLSSNRLSTIEMIAPLMHIPCLQHLFLSGNPMCLLPDYRGRVVSSLPTLETFDGSPVLEIERKESLVLRTDAEEEALKQQQTQEKGGGEGESGDAQLAGGETPAEPDTIAGVEDSEIKEPEIPPEDTKGTFLLAFKMTRISGLKDPNEEPEPPEAPEDSSVFAEEDEEETEEMREFLFYQENPPEFFITLALPGRPPIQSTRVQWAEGGEIQLEVDETVRILATYEALQWLRFEGVTVALFEERRELPEKPKPHKEEAEEGQEAPQESEQTPEPDLDENGEPIPPQINYIITRLAQAVVDTKQLAEFGSDVHMEVPLPQYDEAVDKLLPLNDREVEKALDHARHEEERAARAAKKEQEKAMRKHDHHNKDTKKKSQEQGESLQQHLGGLGLPDKRKEEKEKKEKEKEEDEKRRQKAQEKAEKEKARAAKKAARKKAVVATLDLAIKLNPEEPVPEESEA